MTPRLPLGVATATALVVTMALTGCATGGSPSSTRGSTSAVAPAPAPSKHAEFVIPSTCLPASEVSALLGLPENGPTVTPGPDELICEYLTATEDGAIIYYQHRPGASAAKLAASMASDPPDGSTVTPIPHLGDAAYETSAAGSEGIIVLTGSTLITIGGGQTTLPRLESLAVDVLAG